MHRRGGLLVVRKGANGPMELQESIRVYRILDGMQERRDFQELREMNGGKAAFFQFARLSLMRQNIEPVRPVAGKRRARGAR